MSSPYRVGDHVAVRKAFPPGHVRAPYFIRGKSGQVDQVVGQYGNPEELAYGRKDSGRLALYRVRFQQSEVWSDYEGPDKDTIIIDVYENWLTPAEGTSL